MKLIQESQNKTMEAQILEHIHRVCLDQLSKDHLLLEDDILIQGLIAVSVNQSDVFVVHINDNIHAKGTEMCNAVIKHPIETEIVHLSDEDECAFDGLLASSEVPKCDEESATATECKDGQNHTDFSTMSSELNQTGSVAPDSLDYLKTNFMDDQNVETEQEIRTTESQKQPGLSNDADISIVRHHQRRKRTYKNAGMAIKREPQDASNRYQRNFDLSPNYLVSDDIEHFDHLISPGKHVLDMSFNDELVADLGCIDLDDSFGGIGAHLPTSKGQHLSQYTCRQCGVSCTSEEQLEKHQVLHFQFSVASVTGDIDIDLTECPDNDQLGEPLVSMKTPPGVLSENHNLEYDSLSKLDLPTNGHANGHMNGERTLLNTLLSTTNNEGELSEMISTAADAKIPKTAAATNGEESEQNHKWKTKCLTCGKVFQRTQHLNEHALTHTREKPHKCPRCRKCYRLKSHLKRHMQQCH